MIDPEAVRRLVAESRAAQGLPATVTDRKALATVAASLTRPEEKAA